MSELQLNNNLSNQDRIAILGSSRGLGWSVYQEILKQFPEIHFFLASRKIFQREDEVSKNTVLLIQDFSKTPLNKDFLSALKLFNPTRILYVAGGGPYGLFQEKKWSDHSWALTTTLIYPAELLHLVLTECKSQTESEIKSWAKLTQITFVGSQIAESKPDPNAASYAAAKHGLKGLITSVQAEAVQKPNILLFSPGYMQTDMLPAHSWPIAQGLALSSGLVAKQLIAFIEKNDQR